ncbi:MAG: replication-associated recombination protein A [Bacteroidetes bacterium]|nr:replication-associated recombination protein A [Bacteroidota bacterium]MBK8362562.1 replication-associated recombination protein A [Bacteroidota bacterium]MBK9412733.1 replication-associated recombination protein A [Bacteroidota bacterium]MBP6427762.1 replication-associated recombination protein A [Bacteroidia bacterium]
MIPLAERMRPTTLDQYIGQSHLVGNDAILRKTLARNVIPSIIFWGPPGVGKTTLAGIIAKEIRRPFYVLSAVSSGVKDVREVIEKAQRYQFELKEVEGSPILFIDEIHRFSKSQQDSLLNAVEKGIVTLIGATTENPSFEVISPLLSRCQVYVLKELSKDDLVAIVRQAIKEDVVLKKRNISLKESEALLRLSGGDARKLLNLLELVVNSFLPDAEIEITNEKVQEIVQDKIAIYDKNGEQHYDIISAFIKSMRGSDPNAAVYWLARMIRGGEDLKFIARRMVIFAAEDIGNANPTALVMANTCFEAVSKIGNPEGRIILSQVVVYLATSTKSNAGYMAIEKALAAVDEHGDLPVPLNIRNAPTKLMKELGYGEGYHYDHSSKNSFAGNEFLPDSISGSKFYEPGSNARELEIRNFLKSLWREKYDY